MSRRSEERRNRADDVCRSMRADISAFGGISQKTIDYFFHWLKLELRQRGPPRALHFNVREMRDKRGIKLNNQEPGPCQWCPAVSGNRRTARGERLCFDCHSARIGCPTGEHEIGDCPEDHGK